MDFNGVMGQIPHQAPFVVGCSIQNVESSSHGHIWIHGPGFTATSTPWRHGAMAPALEIVFQT